MASDTDMQAFATSFAQLATNQLSQKVPGIMQKMLGFQVIDKAEDDSRAIGFFGFDFGGSLVYVPAFFLRGEIRGLIAMYIKDKDLFVPLDEKWVEFIESKKHEPLGEGVQGTPSELGITSPDFSQSSPFTYNAKMSSLRLPTWTKGGFEMFKSNPMAARYQKLAGLMEGLRVSPPQIGFKFLNMLKERPKLAEFVLSNYDMDELKDAVLDTSSMKVATAKVLDEVAQELQIITTKVAGMSDSEKEELLKVGYVVRDSRKDTSALIKTDVKMYNSPTQAGFYKVLFKKNGFDDAYVFNTFTVGAGRTKAGMIVYRPGDKFVHKASSRDILTDGAPGLSKTQWTKELAKIGKSPSEVTRGDTVIFVDKHGNATVPFRVDQVVSDAGKTYIKGMEQTWSEWLSEPLDKLPTDYDLERRESYARPLDPDAHGGMSCGVPCTAYSSGFGNSYDTVKQHKGPSEVVVSDKNLDGFVNVGPKLLVPEESSRAIVLGKDDLYTNSGPDGWKEREKEKAARDTLGTANDVENGLRKSASLDRVRVTMSDSGFTLRSDKEFMTGLSKVATIGALTSKFRLHADDAREILKTAAARGSDSFFVKHAINMSDISQPYFDGSINAMANSPVAQNLKDPTMVPSRERTADPNFGQGGGGDIAQMEDAAASGQKDVFDSAALGALININDPSEEINRYISDLILSVDRLGRILFMMYWHYDTFEERYEKQDLVSLEDNLINVFENLGELTLDLSQRAVVDSPTISGFQLG